MRLVLIRLIVLALAVFMEGVPTQAAISPKSTTASTSTDTTASTSTDTTAPTSTDTTASTSTDTTASTSTNTTASTSTDTTASTSTDTTASTSTDTTASTSTDTTASTSNTTASTSTDTTASTSTNTTASTSTDTTASTSTDTSASTSTDTTASTSTDTTASTSTDTTASTSADTTASTSTDTTASTSADTTASTSTDTTASTSTDTTASTSTDTTASTSTDTTASSSKDTTQPSDIATSPGSTAYSSDIHISETNILIWEGNANTSSWFIELTGKANESLDNLTLAVQDATKAVETSLFELHLKGELDENGLFLVNHDSGHERNSVSELENFEEQLKEVKAILLLLYYGDSKGEPLSRDAVNDFLLYAVRPDPALNSAIQEVFLAGESQLIVNLKSFQPKSAKSLSRCPVDSRWALLAPATPGSSNQCQLDVLRLLEMKLTVTVTKCDSTKLPHTAKLQESLTTRMITSVNVNRQCGLTPVMLSDIGVSVRCKDKTIQEYPVRFTVHAAFGDQMAAIVDGYKSFVMETEKITLNGKVYDMTNCTTDCFKHASPPSNNDDDDKIKITVAAVVVCIVVFLAVLLFVIIYMKRKRRGILQFRMARLDEDDDDLIADMDDFVGNQGATFSNFR